MGEMRDSDWSRRNLLRSDWLLPRVALITTDIANNLFNKIDCYTSMEIFSKVLIL